MSGQEMDIPYLVGGEEGFWQPGEANLCLTRDGAHLLAAEQVGDEDAVDVTALAATDVLVQRMFQRLTILGMSGADAARACNGLLADVGAMHAGSGVDEQIVCVRVAHLQQDGTWQQENAQGTEWADASLWPAQEGPQ